MRVGYCKLGRAWNIDPRNWSPVGGDADVWRTLDLLARRNPHVTYVLIGRNSGESPQECGLPANVEQFWTDERRAEWRERTSGRHSPMTTEEIDRVISVFDDMTIPTWTALDGVIVWAGQHGTSNSRIRMTDGSGKYTNPQDAFVLYGAYITRGVSAWREADPVNREEIWLCPDPRNYIKCRDLRWPLRRPVISQFVQTREQKFERYVDGEPPHPDFPLKKTEHGHIWVSKTQYTYDQLELTALPDPSTVPFDPYTARTRFGLVINENRKNVTNPRLNVMLEWVVPWFPDYEVFGQWTPDSQERLGRTIETVPLENLYSTLQRWRCTLTTPASGSGWATAKMWECFLAGTICFIHPKYDTQGHIIPLSPAKTDDPDLKVLSEWLRPQTPQQLAARVATVCEDSDLYLWLAQAQRRYVEREHAKLTPIIAIERRLGLAAA